MAENTEGSPVARCAQVMLCIQQVGDLDGAEVVLTGCCRVPELGDSLMLVTIQYIPSF